MKSREKLQPVEKPRGKNLILTAASLNDAYKKGYFSGGMSREDLMWRVTYYNPQLRWFASKYRRGLFDKEKKLFVCGIANQTTIPRFTVMQYDKNQERKYTHTTSKGEELFTETLNPDPEKGKVLSRSWIATFNIIRSNGYWIKDDDIDY